MIIDVIACGESALNYTNKGNVTVGVNDCYKIYPVDYLVCVDLPSAFSKKRLKIILKSKPKKFFCPFDDWRNMITMYEHIKLVNASGCVKELNKKEKICYSNNSPFVAVVMAYHLGATKIKLYGADFNTHRAFKNENNFKKTLKDFRNLNSEMLRNGCKLYVTKESKLSAIIPTFRIKKK